MLKCAACSARAVTRRSTVTRITFGVESAVPLCASCDSMTDIELVLALLPMDKHDLAKRFIYGITGVPPSAPDRFYGTVCISDIQVPKLSWKGYGRTK